MRHTFTLLMLMLFLFESYAISTTTSVSVSGPSSSYNNTSVTFTGTLSGGYFTQGSVGFQPVVSSASTNWTLERSNGAVIRSATVPGRASFPGNTISWDVDIDGIPPGSYTVRAVHDWCVEALNGPYPYSSCTSINDTFSLTVIEALPDLKVTGVSVCTSSVRNCSGTQIYEFTVLNDGIASAPESTARYYFNISASIGLEGTTAGSTLTIPELDPGQTHKVRGRFSVCITANINSGSQVVGVVLDDNNQVKEISEDNNEGKECWTDVDFSRGRSAQSEFWQLGLNSTLSIRTINNEVIWEPNQGILDFSNLPQDQLLIHTYYEGGVVKTRQIIIPQ